MTFELTKNDIQEIALCIVRCDLNEDEAIEYAVTTAKECHIARNNKGAE